MHLFKMLIKTKSHFKLKYRVVYVVQIGGFALKMKGFYVVLLLFPIAGCAIIVTKPTDGNGPLGVFPGNQPEGVLPGAKLEATTDSGVITGYAIVIVVPDDNTFDIDADTGQLSLAAGKAFGFETTTEYVLKIDVTDSIVTATATVTIMIREDDEVPMFANNPTVNVDNGAAVGFNVITYPASDKEDDEQTYSIVHGNKDDDFDISSTTGVIRVAKKLDFARTPKYILKVKTKETTTFLHVATGTVTVNVCEAKCPTDSSNIIHTTWLQAVFMIAMPSLFFRL